jgi:hypothetical protein
MISEQSVLIQDLSANGSAILFGAQRGQQVLDARLMKNT